jgi:threonine/homoserine/homoserine lactone efflux protein
MSLISFALTAILILVTPGPTNTILAASGAAMGWRKAAFLPLAEAAGYMIAIIAYLALTTRLADIEGAMPLIKWVAVVWLLYSAWKLWTQPVQSAALERAIATRRVFFTTILNPKALLIGAILIPTVSTNEQPLAVIVFIILSIGAGVLWTGGGSALPSRFRPIAYKIAAIIIGMFSLISASSALAG